MRQHLRQRLWMLGAIAEIARRQNLLRQLIDPSMRPACVIATILP
jgi:hypothetical protein